jgi:hypothetical protein
MRTRSEFVFRKRFPRHHDTRSNRTESLTRSSPHIPAQYRCWAGGVFLSQRLQQHPGPSVVPEPPSNLALLHKEHGSTRTPSNLALLHKAQALPPFNVSTALQCYVQYPAPKLHVPASGRCGAGGSRGAVPPRHVHLVTYVR